MGDAVVRFVVPAMNNSKAIVENKVWFHNNTNTMIETEEKEITLQLIENKKIKFRWLYGFPKCPFSMTSYLYARDQPAKPKDKHKHSSLSAWVLHGRVLIDMPAVFVFRFFRNHGVIWDNTKINKILFDQLNLYKYWRAREFNVASRMQTQGLWPLKSGDSIELAVELEAII